MGLPVSAASPRAKHRADTALHAFPALWACGSMESSVTAEPMVKVFSKNAIHGC